MPLRFAVLQRQGAVRGAGRAAGLAACARGVLHGAAHGGVRRVQLDPVPDTARNRAWLGRVRHRLGFAGYPLVHLMALAETGTRALLGAVIAGQGEGGETALARRLLHLLGPGMLVLTDRAFDPAGFLAPGG